MNRVYEKKTFALLRKLHFVISDYLESGEISPGGEAAVIRKLEDLRGEVLEHIERRIARDLSDEPFNSDRVPIYRVPCSYTGLAAELDQCESVEVHRVHDTSSPISDGCAGRYITTDGLIFDCSIDSTNFANWFGLDDLEEV